MRLLQGILLPAILLAAGVVAKSKPEIELTKFESQPVNLFYFEDTETVITVERDSGKVWRSKDAGAKWSHLDDISEEVLGIFRHPFDNKVAVAIGRDTKHWITKNQGKDWDEFETSGPVSHYEPIVFHASDSDRMIIQGDDSCYYGSLCIGKSWYTKDGFKSIKQLRDDRKSCLWAQSTDLFTTGSTEKDNNRILCIVKGKYSDPTRREDYRLVISDNYFDDEFEAELNNDRTVPGVANMASVKSYIVVAVKAEGTDELGMFVTKDTNKWHRAEFGDHKIEEDAYTILESTNYSMQVDVMTSKLARTGSLFTSNTDGAQFSRNIEHTHRSETGYVDFEKVQNIQGIVLVNVVDNWESVEKSWLEEPKLKTRISFDDGRDFHALKVGSEDLHLHSVTDQRNSGRIFSSAAPGIIMGVGNRGPYLKDYKQGDLYVSDDAGLTWKRALKEAHKYEFGDKGAVLVAIYDEGETQVLRYSLNHGEDWEEVDLPKKIFAQDLTTIPDSTSLQFILVANDRSDNHYIISIDFSEMDVPKCKDDDFEMWHARVDEDDNEICVMGQKQSFRRRKSNSKCFVQEEFKDPVPKFEPCKCSKLDYECDAGFRKEGKGEDANCTPQKALTAPDGSCLGDAKTFKAPSGWRLIPGNKCKKDDSLDLEKDVDRLCDETKKPAEKGKVSHEITKFNANKIVEWYYLQRSHDYISDDDETVVMRTDDPKNNVYYTNDHGKKWHRVDVDTEITAIYPHQYYTDRAYFLTPSKKVYYTTERMRNGLSPSHSFDTPLPPTANARLLTLGFHPKQEDWLLWTGSKDCDGASSGCHSECHITKKHGMESSWEPLLTWVEKCQFVYHEMRQNGSHAEQLVYCEQYEAEDRTKALQLLSSDDFFEHKKVVFEDIVSFATMSEFIIVAARTEDRKFLKLDASIDGSTFAAAHFPPNFKVEHQQAYTVLDSSTNSIFLHVTVNANEDREYGSLIKSNSNGTSYVLSLEKVNRNRYGYVDFEKLLGLQGVAVANIVGNVGEVESGAAKKLKTVITHNDGAEWAPIPAPEEDSEGKTYPCSDKKKCSLHLHGYTERFDPRETFSSPTAVGLMMAVGNVGEYLTPYRDGNTFLSTDGGITWREIRKGTFTWEYGDQGSVIAIVRRDAPTNVIFYSLDEGDTWTSYDFSDEKMEIKAISTTPKDNSLNFLLWGMADGTPATVNIDFTGMFGDKPCKLDEEHPEQDDYDLWTPKHPLQDDDCLFGKVSRYHRKKKGHLCYNGPKVDRLHVKTQDCECTPRDYECDYNYERRPDGYCRLVYGLEKPDAMRVCKDDNAWEYWDITGYRKIPISSCKGGKELEYTGESHPCPGHEKEYQQKRGISGIGLFFAIVLPFAAAGAIGFYVWQNWDNKFGRIRLGDSTSRYGGGNPWVEYPVAALSGLVAVLAAVPLLLGSLWRAASSRFGSGGYGGRTYTSRSSFARGRGDYMQVDPDEGELLGDDSDEET